MSKQDVEHFFNEYIFGFIFVDIQREIDLARSGENAGNFLSALGLLCYTEFMGGIAVQSFKGRARSRFNRFLYLMGSGYQDFDNQVNVYSVFRCGMAHEYFIKENCKICMLNNGETLGIGIQRNGQYYFVVERYFTDFASACKTLYKNILAEPNPMIPKS